MWRTGDAIWPGSERGIPHYLRGRNPHHRVGGGLNDPDMQPPAAATLKTVQRFGAHGRRGRGPLCAIGRCEGAADARRQLSAGGRSLALTRPTLRLWANPEILAVNRGASLGARPAST